MVQRSLTQRKDIVVLIEKNSLCLLQWYVTVNNSVFQGQSAMTFDKTEGHLTKQYVIKHFFTKQANVRKHKGHTPHAKHHTL